MRFIHLSDIHFYPEGDDFISNTIRDELVKKVAALCGTKPFDLLFITGDFRHAGKQHEKKKINEYAKNSSDYIKEVAYAAGICDLKNVILLPGNHDLTRPDNETKKNIVNIWKSYSSNKGVFDQIDILLNQFDFFRAVCSELYGEGNSPWPSNKPHIWLDRCEYVILCLNTALFHVDDEETEGGLNRGKLLVGTMYLKNELDDIKKNAPNKPIIVLAHHSPELFLSSEIDSNEMERGYVRTLLGNQENLNLYLCGDAHKVGIYSDHKYGYIEITMGCIKEESKEVKNQRGAPINYKSEATFLVGDLDNGHAEPLEIYQWNLRPGTTSLKYAWERSDSLSKQVNDLFNSITALQNNSNDAEDTQPFQLTLRTIRSILEIKTGKSNPLEKSYLSYRRQKLRNSPTLNRIIVKQFESDAEFLDAVLTDTISRKLNALESNVNDIMCGRQMEETRTEICSFLKFCFVSDTEGIHGIIEKCKRVLRNTNEFYIMKDYIFDSLDEEGRFLRSCYQSIPGDAHYGLALFVVYALLGSYSFQYDLMDDESSNAKRLFN